MYDQRVTIYQGADVSPIIRLKNPKTLDPIDLTNATKIAFEFNNSDRTKLLVDDTTVPAVAAKIDYEEVTFIAVNSGASGNDIILQFNGLADIQTVIDDWNTANPSNTVTFSNGNGSDVLSEGTVRLTNGYNAYSPVEVLEAAVLGKVKLTLLEKQTLNLKSGPNQTFNVIIDFGTFPGGTRIRGRFDKLDVVYD